jgi:hypothetical protein
VKLGDRRGSVPSVAPDAGPLERDHVLRDSGAALLLTTGVTAATATEVEKVPGQPDGDVASEVTRGSPGPDAVALILYTRGTTGPPKGGPQSASRHGRPRRLGRSVGRRPRRRLAQALSVAQARPRGRHRARRRGRDSRPDAGARRANPAEVMHDVLAFATAGRSHEERDQIAQSIQGARTNGRYTTLRRLVTSRAASPGRANRHYLEASWVGASMPGWPEGADFKSARKPTEFQVPPGPRSNRDQVARIWPGRRSGLQCLRGGSAATGLLGTQRGARQRACSPGPLIEPADFTKSALSQGSELSCYHCVPERGRFGGLHRNPAANLCSYESGS